MSQHRGSKRGRGSDKPTEIGALDCISKEAALLRAQLEKVTNENANLSHKLDQLKKEKNLAVERMNDNVSAFKDAKGQLDKLKTKIKVVSTMLVDQKTEWKEEMDDIYELSKLKNIRSQTLRTPDKKQPFRYACQELMLNDDLVKLCTNDGEDPMESLTTLLSRDITLLKDEVVANLRQHMLRLLQDYLSALPRFAKSFVVTHKGVKQPLTLWYVKERGNNLTARDEVASVLLDYVLADMKNYSTMLDQSSAAKLQKSFAGSMDALIKRERKIQLSVITSDIEALMVDLWEK